MTIDELAHLVHLVCEAQYAVNKCFDERLDKIQKLVSEFEGMFEDETSEKEEKPENFENKERVYVKIGIEEFSKICQLEDFRSIITYRYPEMPSNELGCIGKIHFLHDGT